MVARVSVEDSFYNKANIWVAGASQFICEDEEDVASLPAMSEKTVVGSRAMVISTGNIYILGPSKGWQKYKGVSIID